MTIGSRREARERALSLLYEADRKAMPAATVLAELPLVPDSFVVDLVTGVAARAAEIDELIGRFAIAWSVERMPVIDRTLLRMATYELLARPDVPTGAVISEAVDLARAYSTEESGRFVNGMLSSIAGVTRTKASDDDVDHTVALLDPPPADDGASAAQAPTSARSSIAPTADC